MRRGWFACPDVRGMGLLRGRSSGGRLLRARGQEALVAIGLCETLEEAEPRRRCNSTSALTSPGAMTARFAEYPEAVAETERLAERLRFDLTEQLGYRYPGREDPTADADLARLCDHQLGERYAGNAR